MAVNKFWLLACLLWALLGASCLYTIDGSVVAGVVWLAAGVFIGCFGGLFLERFVEMLPHRGKHMPTDVLLFMPLAGLIVGTLSGPMIGAGAASRSPGDAWRGALLGAVVGPPVASFLFLAACTVVAALKEGSASQHQREKSELSARQRWMMVVLCAALPLVALLVIVRCLAWIPRRRQRLKAFGKLQDLGAVFSADPARDVFYGITLERLAFEDEHARLLRAFPELDHVSLAGTAVTDAGVSCLRRLWNLRIVSLAGTAVTDAALVHLTASEELTILNISDTRLGDGCLAHVACFRHLQSLNVHGTLVTNQGLRRLLQTLPSLKIKR
jgi:hypothetical protein